MKRSARLTLSHAFALRSLARSPSSETWRLFPLATRTTLLSLGLATWDRVPRLTLSGAMILVRTVRAS